MADRTAIEWSDSTWNPITGCTKVSPGCANCYIERTPPFRMAGRRFVRGAIPVQLHPERLEQPLHWRKPRRVFVVSMGDLFHEDVPDAFIDRVFHVMARAKHHTFQILTKRPERMRRHFAARCGQLEVLAAMGGRKGTALVMPHIWLGVSVENQRMADERIPLLLETPAAVRFLSCEPLLGPLDLTPWLGDHFQRPCSVCGKDTCTVFLYARPNGADTCAECAGRYPVGPCDCLSGIDWTIVGGESGPGRAERKLVERCEPRVKWSAGPAAGGIPYDHWREDLRMGTYCEECSNTSYRPKPHALEWLHSIRDQCQAAGVPFFFKQWGGPTPKAGGRRVDGREWNEMPQEAVLAQRRGEL